MARDLNYRLYLHPLVMCVGSEGSSSTAQALLNLRCSHMQKKHNLINCLFFLSATNQEMHFWYNVSTVQTTEPLLEAEFHVFRMSPKPNHTQFLVPAARRSHLIEVSPGTLSVYLPFIEFRVGFVQKYHVFYSISLFRLKHFHSLRVIA